MNPSSRASATLADNTQGKFPLSSLSHIKEESASGQTTPVRKKRSVHLHTFGRRLFFEICSLRLSSGGWLPRENGVSRVGISHFGCESSGEFVVKLLGVFLIEFFKHSRNRDFLPWFAVLRHQKSPKNNIQNFCKDQNMKFSENLGLPIGIRVQGVGENVY